MMDIDVYAYGVIAASRLYQVKDDYPARGGYAEIVAQYQNVGGEAANSAIVLARLGLRVKLDGNWINPDGDAEFLREVFQQNRVDISRLTFRECQGPKEMLVVDPTSRTIFGTYAQLLAEESWNQPEKSDIQNAQVICLDPFFGRASQQVAEYAQAFHKPVVTVDCKFDDPLFLAADVAIIAEEYIGHTYPEQNIAAITAAYKARARGTVIFTFGHKEIIYGGRNTDFQRLTPYQIDPVDTTGAGDSFRAGIIYGYLQGWPMEKTIAFASAVAALVCQSLPGVLHAPTVDAVNSFIRSNPAGGTSPKDAR